MRDYLPEGKVEPLSFPEVIETPVSWGDLNLVRADNFKAIVNPETGKVFSIVSKDYRLIRHEEAIQKVEHVLSEFPDIGKCIIKTEFYNDAARMKRTYRLKEKTTELRRGDYIDPEIQLYNSYDTSWPFVLNLGVHRVVCKNGLTVLEKYFHLRRRHVVYLERVDLQEQITTAFRHFDLQAGLWKKWTDRRLTERTYIKVLETMKFGKHATGEIEEHTAREAEGFDDNKFPIISVWLFFNVLTWYITHRAVSLNHRVELERRLRTAMRHLNKRPG